MDVMGWETVGDEDYDDDMDGEEVVDLEGDVLGARGRRRRHRRKGTLVRLPPKPGWRRRQIAPGIQAVAEGLEPLPLTGDLNGGVFNAANPAITFAARPQRPFRAERLLASVVLTGGATGIVVCDGIFIGTSLQTVQRGAFDVAFFAANSFGVRLCLAPAQPGVDVSLPCRFVGTIGAGTAVVSLLFLGRTLGQ